MIDMKNKLNIMKVIAKHRNDGGLSESIDYNLVLDPTDYSFIIPNNIDMSKIKIDVVEKFISNNMSIESLKSLLLNHSTSIDTFIKTIHRILYLDRNSNSLSNLYKDVIVDRTDCEKLFIKLLDEFSVIGLESDRRYDVNHRVISTMLNTIFNSYHDEEFSDDLIDHIIKCGYINELHHITSNNRVGLAYKRLTEYTIKNYIHPYGLSNQFIIGCDYTKYFETAKKSDNNRYFDLIKRFFNVIIDNDISNGTHLIRNIYMNIEEGDNQYIWDVIKKSSADYIAYDIEFNFSNLSEDQLVDVVTKGIYKVYRYKKDYKFITNNLKVVKSLGLNIDECNLDTLEIVQYMVDVHSKIEKLDSNLVRLIRTCILTHKSMYAVDNLHQTVITQYLNSINYADPYIVDEILTERPNMIDLISKDVYGI